mgnify:CR=1 FL=1
MNTEAENVVVIAVGASAGGVNALKRFFSKYELHEAAVVVVQHLDVHGKELANEVLHHFTKLPVDEIVHGTYITPGRVFIAPPQKLISVEDGQFVIQEISEPAQKFATIDWFMNSASQFKERAIGVLLSGEGMDGSMGLKTISENGGLTLTQDEESSEHPSMPRTAAELGFVDHVLKPEDMSEVFRGYLKYLAKFEKNFGLVHLQEEIGAAIISICEILLKHTQHDFKHYKTSTMVRRIQRRMLVLQINSVDEYVNTLTHDKKERDSLFNDLLINVTSFFRDPEAFDLLKNEVLRPEIKKIESKKKYRIWVAGCSTGEEAYTMAILALEVMEEYGMKNEVQIIATDIDEDALNTGRKGEYPLSIADKVSPERLEKHFQRRNGRFVVSRQLREMILFSSHNLINDPPFSQVDLISCRNVLIYLGPHLQKKLIPVFHYSLKPNGFLFLGTSEALGTHKDLFNPINVKYRLAQRRPTAINMHSQQLFNSMRPVYSPHFNGAPKNHEEDLHLIGQRIVLDEFAPKFAIIGDEGQILSVSAGIQEYLEPSEGAFQNNIIKLVLQNLRAPLRSSLNEAKKEKRQIQNQTAIVRTGRGLIKVGLVVQPMPQLGEHTGLYMVVFRDMGLVSEKDIVESTSTGVDFAVVEELERELSRLREELDKTIQDLEASNEELKSSNEELLSMNEELQSANEELEISKEEVQRGNDILLSNNIDLENLLNSTKIATIFLDEELNIKNFTPYIREIYDLLPQDIGRPISSFNSKAISMPRYSNPQDLKPEQVIETEVLMPDGRVFLRRKSAYINQSRKKAGLVITFVDITELRRSEELFRTLANSVPQMIWSTDENGNYIYFSDQWMDFSGIDPVHIKNKGFREIVHPDDVEKTMEAWNLAQKEKDFFSYQYRLRDKFGVYHWHLVRARAMKDAFGKVYRWFGTCTNIQEAKDLEISLRASKLELQKNQDRFNNVANAVGLGVWYCNLPFDVLNWSETVKKQFWCDSQDHITIKTFYDRIHVEDRERTREAIEDSIKNNEHYDINYRTVDPKSGRIKWIRAIGWTDYAEDGSPKRFDGVTLDITEELRSLDALRDSEWRYTMASKATRELIWDWDLMTNGVKWNESLTVEFGYSEEDRQSTGDWWLAHIHPDDRQRVTDSIHQVIDHKINHWSDEYRFLKADGSYAHVLDRGYLQVNDDGRAVRMIGTMYDQTERNEYLMQMKDAIRARDEFLSIASHELKTPLTSMVLQMQMLKRRMERGQIDETIIHKANDLTLKQCQLLTSLIDDMLDVSRISNGKMNFSFKETSLQEVVTTALEAFSANAEEKEVEVHFTVKEDSIVKADPFRLEQVIYNLLSNALKYGEQKPIEIQVARKANHAIVEVRDQGLGINPENIARIFKLFERAISSTSISGLGLGLYISKEIIDAHDGDIEVESKVNAGSVFRVIIPIV